MRRDSDSENGVEGRKPSAVSSESMPTRSRWYSGLHPWNSSVAACMGDPAPRMRSTNEITSCTASTSSRSTLSTLTPAHTRPGKRRQWMAPRQRLCARFLIMSRHTCPLSSRLLLLSDLSAFLADDRRLPDSSDSASATAAVASPSSDVISLPSCSEHCTPVSMPSCTSVDDRARIAAYSARRSPDDVLSEPPAAAVHCCSDRIRSRAGCAPAS
mmetsp:Transcript_28064/g.90633  ORF Transcript_28064/g.90633 Transcript_28064/m.90633 type:complete len:214 (+) Transcript_28064:1227-1868(+)